MFEIELKARVEDSQKIKEKLDSLGVFEKSVKKDDEYWELAEKRARLRTETEFSKDGMKKIKNFFTYKRKETRGGIEVNDEQECSLNEIEPIRAFFLDCGMKIALKKQKIVSRWKIGSICAELCTIPPLGDFLELEIMSESDSPQIVEKEKRALFEILEKCGLSKDLIEPRYYSELLAEARNENP